MFLSYAELISWSLGLVGILLTGVFVIVRMWAKDRFKSIERRTANLEDSVANQRRQDDSIVRTGDSKRG